uniref:Uncharacterized protein n=1 Tax=Arundo donax TaxID=35708 RepID=A0A0A9F9J4_ARUDO
MTPSPARRPMWRGEVVQGHGTGA